MAKKQNPYQLWLGLNPKFTNPNLFQLLGVDPRSQDEAAIKQKAVTSAKALLQKLKAVEVKNDAEKVFKQKLHAKIILAHETILAPEKRKKYLNALVANAAAEKKTTATPGSTAADATVANQAVPNSPNAPVTPPLTPPTPANPIAGNPPADIPAAIPMAMPVSVPPAATNHNEDASAFSTEPPVGQSAPNFDNLDAEPRIKVYAKKRKTSRSWVVPIVVLTLLVGGIGGLVSMMTKYSNIFEFISALNEKVNTVAVDPSATKEKELNSKGVESESLRVPNTPHQAIDYRGTEEPDMETPEGGVPLLVKPNSEGSMTKPKLKPAMKPGAEKENNWSPDVEQRALNKTDVEDASQENRTLVDSQLNSIRMGLHRSRDALFRQNLELAKHFNGDVKNLLKRYKIASAEVVAPQQRGLIRAAETNDQIIGWVADFWEQVKLSSIEREGGDSITVGDKTMSLVEATDEDIVLRIAGRNERIRYSNLTPLLASTLGELGSKESVPRWNLAQAAFLGLMSEQYDNLKQLQLRILNQVRIDGFDLESQVITDFTEPDWLKLGLPEEKLAPFTDDEFNEIIIKTRKQIGYENPSSVPTEQIDAFIYKLTLNPSGDPATRIARLWEAVAMIKKAHRVSDLMLVNRELDSCCTEVDFNKSFVEPILNSSKEAQDPTFQDDIARQMINFVKKFDGNPNFTPTMRAKLISRLEEIAKDLESSQLAAMAQQLSSSN